VLIDANLGGTVEAGWGDDAQTLVTQVRAADAAGYDGVWTTEVKHDPFLPLAVATQHSSRLLLGTGIAVAFARNPMSVAATANDLQTLSAGRFSLGLGSQIRPHIERRYSMPWSAPADRMREFITALKSIWDCWATGTPLRFEGSHYTHTLLTPMFDPGPNPHGPPPVLLAAVGERMTAVAGSVADGLLVHALTTERYLREVTDPAIQNARAGAGRAGETFTVSYPGLVVTGRDEAEMAVAAAAVRKQLAFYGSTPAYRGVLEHHGWGALQPQLQSLSRQGEWDAMARLIDDEMLSTFAVLAEPDQVGSTIRRRFDGVVDRFTLYTPYSLHRSVEEQIVRDMHRVQAEHTTA
jgi:probable F420-dependent oxidoreductase